MIHMLADEAATYYNVSYLIGRIVGFLILAVIVLLIVKAVFKKR